MSLNQCQTFLHVTVNCDLCVTTETHRDEETLRERKKREEGDEGCEGRRRGRKFPSPKVSYRCLRQQVLGLHVQKFAVGHVTATSDGQM